MGRVIHWGKKREQSYKGIVIRADLGLHEEVAQAVCDRVSQGSMVLDWGSGEGALSERLADLGYCVTAVDVRKEAFQATKADFVQVDFNDPEQVRAFVDAHRNVFDAAVGVEAIEHVENPWEYVRALTAMVRPGGWVFITTPNIESWLSRCMFFFRGRFHQFDGADLEYGHINPISSWEIQVIMHKLGLEDVSVRGAGTLPPIYYGGSAKVLLISIVVLPLRPFMRGVLDGWCLLAVGRKRR